MTRVPDDELDFDEELIFYYRGQPFTGIAYDDSPDGGKTEIVYVDGMQEGAEREWYADGTLKAESFYKENLRHGPSRQFGADGRLLLEEVYDCGSLITRLRYDGDGRLVDHYQLKEGSPNHEVYLQMKSRLDWPSAH